MLDCEPKAAVAFMTGVEGDVDMSSLRLSGMIGRLSRMRRIREGNALSACAGLDEIRRDMNNRPTSDAMYDFFIHPPGKKEPTNIEKPTVDHYGLFCRNWGYYKNRVIIPFLLDESLVGFCAVDLLGKEEWLRQHPLQNDGDYKKVLYPKNFKSGEYLFGYDDCEKQADYVILTEGAREVMKLWQMGFRNSVAVLGGNVTDGHILLLSKKAPKSIVLMFDGDDAGYLFTEKASGKLNKLFNIKKCLLPIGKDPKNLGKEEATKMVNNAISR